MLQPTISHKPFILSKKIGEHTCKSENIRVLKHTYVTRTKDESVSKRQNI